MMHSTFKNLVQHEGTIVMQLGAFIENLGAGQVVTEAGIGKNDMPVMKKASGPLNTYSITGGTLVRRERGYLLVNHLPNEVKDELLEVLRKHHKKELVKYKAKLTRLNKAEALMKE